MTPAERKEAERYAMECMKGHPTYVPSRRERELGALVISLLRQTESVRPEAVTMRPATVRLNKDRTLDEVFADPCQFHLEQMSATHWWIGINAPDKFFHINLHSKAKIGALIEDEARHDPSPPQGDASK
jgi:hypothetical protein